MIDIWERASRVGAWVIVCGSLVALLGFWTYQVHAPKRDLRTELVEVAETNRGLMLRLSLAEQATRAALERPCAE